MTAEPITVVGLDGGPLSDAAAEAVRDATLLIGADQHVSALPDGLASAPLTNGVRVGLVEDLRGHEGPAVVLATGDPGFFGVVRVLRAGGLTPRVVPAPSMVQRLFGAIGRPWDDAAVLRADAQNLRAVVNVCRARPAVAIMTGAGAGPREIGAGLHGWPRTFVVVENAGSPNELLSTVDASEAGWRDWRDPDLMLCLRDPDVVPPSCWYAGGEPTPPPGGWALPESAFHHREGLLPSREVRAIVLARLAPRPGMLVWDIGAGSGSIAVECARMGAAVLAVERDPGQCVRLIANTSAHGVEVCVVEDSAPGVFGMLPEPDAIFVGGGGPEVVMACTATGASRIVVALDGLDGFAASRDALVDGGYTVDGCQLTVSQLVQPDKGASRLVGTAPVLLLTGTR
jgi:precorrin-6B C5,15-methyltransferase / cobalt-precorrin-6B C5,C15-methyltransferase